ncbi:hypothetical protein QMK17_23865 [Rhodococcus sp. G-MC3]|uniref:hypothetical protein n=1 Tax=Rhodococcus sp. G-MC3 TaxID=3046209 RepID=UPI0024BB4A89|nr:hypothetical protein [Rhodococcus sp. G-MC3]MDJ0396346.1 hypothetical protein [Rhodococcus sp. G-MC3]
MNESLTSNVALTESIQTLARSLAALPVGVSLVRVHPEFPHAHMMFGRFEPCYDDNMTVEGPVRFTARFWVTGNAGPSNAQALLDRWREWEWDVYDSAENGRDTTRVVSPEGYKVIAQLSVDGHLSVGVSSPCFPFENGENLDNPGAPAAIERR